MAAACAAMQWPHVLDFENFERFRIPKYLFPNIKALQDTSLSVICVSLLWLILSPLCHLLHIHSLSN